jgi:dihydrofolate reductase
MKVTMIDVVSINGKITQGDSPNVQEWTSPEDTAQFKQVMAEHDVIVMGRKTYDAVRPQPTADTLRIVLTRYPEQFTSESSPGALEFTDRTPRQLVDQLARGGHTNLLLVGGSEINSAFLEHGLVDELILTVEPWLFGSGINLIGDASRGIACKLLSVSQLNEQGTLLLRYAVAK